MWFWKLKKKRVKKSKKIKKWIKRETKSTQIDLQKQRNPKTEFENLDKSGIINIDGALF